MRHQRRDAYWKRGSVCEDFSDIKIPVYAISGWDDTYSNAVPRLMEGLIVPCKGLIGPWTHAYPFLGEPGPAINYLKEAIRWWRHWLEGIDTGIMDEPTYTAWINDPHAPAPYFEDHPGHFVAGQSWPSPNIMQNRLYLNKGSLSEMAEFGEAMFCARRSRPAGIAAAMAAMAASFPIWPPTSAARTGWASVSIRHP